MDDHHAPPHVAAAGHPKMPLLHRLHTRLSYWWTRVLFAGVPAPAQPQSPASVTVHLTVLLLLAALLFFTRLSCPLLEPEEARYAEIPRQMLAEQTLLMPVLNGLPYYQKPPLLYWAVMASYQVFGVHDWSARLVPCSAAVLLVLFVYLWGRKPLGQQTAFLGALVLCLSARFLYLGRMLTMDTLLTLWVTAGLLAAYRAIHTPQLRWRWWLIGSLACGLGLLTKGPVALVLVAVPTFLCQCLDQRFSRPTLRAWLAFVGLAFGVAVPWYLSMALYNPRAALDFFWLHHVVRYVDPVDHAKPPWFYVLPLLVGMLPWSLLLLPLGRFLAQKSAAITCRRPPALGFFLLAFLWSLVFFSCSGCKRAVYILPALPPLALVLGCYLAHALSWQTVRRWGIEFALPCSQAALGRLLTMGMLLAAVGGCVAAVQFRLWQPAAGTVIAAILLGLLLVWLACGSRLSARISWVSCTAVVFLLLWGTVYELLPSYNRHFALRGQVRPCLEICERQNLPVLCYPHGWDSVGFYLGKEEVHVYSAKELPRLMADLRQQQRGLVFLKADHARRFLDALPASLAFVPQQKQRDHLVVGVVRPRGAPEDWLLVQR